MGVATVGTLNGFGTDFRGFTARQSDGSHYATKWFTAGFMPVVPLARYQLIIGSSESSANEWKTDYEELGRTPLRWQEIAVTYVGWWLVMPVVVLGPLLVAYALGVGRDGGPRPSSSTWACLLVSFGLVWLIGAPIGMSVITRRRRRMPIA
jgi:hypothetical protein